MSSRQNADREMSSNVVHYHLPDDDQFSLDFVNPDGDVIDDRLDRYDEVTETRVQSYNLDETVHVIYTKTNEATETEDIEYEFSEAFDQMDSDTRVIVRYILEMFETIQKQKHDEEGVPLDAYKDVEIERIPDALDQVNWAETVPNVGGQLASNLILCHALPNANHRTSFSVFEGYVRAAAGPSFELPSMVTDDYEWETWVDDYIVRSKRMLTVRRNVGPFRYLSDFGCQTIRRKGGIAITLSEYDLDLQYHEALTRYAHQHERQTSGFAERLLDRTNSEELTTKPGIDKSEFADYIRSKT